MEHADVLLTGGVVVTMNKNYDVFPNGALAVRDNLIVAVGPTKEISSQFTAAEVVDCAGTYVTPGLVDPHTHCYHSATALGVEADPIAVAEQDLGLDALVVDEGAVEAVQVAEPVVVALAGDDGVAPPDGVPVDLEGMSLALGGAGRAADDQ